MTEPNPTKTADDLTHYMETVSRYRQALKEISQIGTWSASTRYPVPQFNPSNAAWIALRALAEGSRE